MWAAGMLVCQFRKAFYDGIRLKTGLPVVVSPGLCILRRVHFIEYGFKPHAFSGIYISDGVVSHIGDVGRVGLEKVDYPSEDPGVRLLYPYLFRSFAVLKKRPDSHGLQDQT